MKKIKFIILFLLTVSIAYSQSFTQKGVVTSVDGETLIGVSIVLQATTTGTVTNIDGEYSISVNPGDKLVFSYVGFVPQEVVVKRGQAILDVQLVPDQNTNLEEVVVVGYGKAKRLTMTGSVSAITAREIRIVPTSSVQNALSGKLPGFFSQQRSGQPGKDASDFFIRGVSSLNDAGNQPLIIVDDVQYSYDQLQQINVNEIESISILKDASTTAIYGIKGANGVLVVKTRRGEEGAPQINLRVESGLQSPIRVPKFLNSYETAKLVNEAYVNDGLISQVPFTDDDLDMFKNGSSPYTHPDVNWYREIFRPLASQQNVNLDISGGSKKLRYFVSGGYFTQDGLIKNFNIGSDDVNTNYFFRRFNYRTNLDFDVTSNLNMRLDFSTRFMNINEPSSMNATGEIYNFEKMTPYASPVLNPDGSFTYLDTKGFLPTLNARLANEGYKRTKRNDINILYGAIYKMDYITKGLSANFRLAYSSIDENYRRVSRGSDGYPTYRYHPENDIYVINPNQKYAYSTYGVNSGVDQALSDLNIQASVNYERVFNEDHDVSGMLLYNRQSRTNEHNASVPNNFEGYTLTSGYKYKNKYLIDVNLAYNGTDRFGKNSRFGFFPAVGLGYAISEEGFFKYYVNNVQMLKIRGSYGLVGSDAAPGDRYLFRQVYEKGGGYYFGENPQKYDSYREGAMGNEFVTWEKAKKLDIGIDLVAFNKLSFTIDFFHDTRFDQLVTRYDIPLILGIGVSPLNVARTINRGFDGSLGYQTRIGQVNFNSNLVFSFAKNKVIYKAEAQQRYPWLAETGKAINQPFGYKFIGFYTPEDISLIANEDPDAPAVPNTDTPVQAGDLKYLDMNNDGIIDDFDKMAIGKPNLPSTTVGWTLAANWKGFSLSLLFQGSFDYSFSVIGTGIESFKSQFQPVHQKRWTLKRYQNGEEIDFPRLTTIPSTVNSAEGYMSDFWLVDAWYLRLKTVDFAYQLPKRVLPSYINSARIYTNAYNLFTLTNYTKYQQDPEISTNTAGDAYMNQRVFNLGVQVTF
ncbi:MAG: SusC/RagA family TonB-linked outer membrane protein [Bacteroidales bacterium 36-12]|nr:MAG: SusC/RagA family TonB-linked outer membrane protein [Bacteroidales bacterium 36-12]